MDKTLTPFQRTCLQELERALSAVGGHLEDVQWHQDHPVLGGENSTYLQARVSGTAVEVWVYGDQADVGAPGNVRVFESLDYDSPEELTRAFVRAVIENLGAHGLGEDRS